MRRQAQMRDVPEVWMSARVQLIAEELLNVRSPKIPRRQADTMDNEKIDLCGRDRARILVWRMRASHSG